MSLHYITLHYITQRYAWSDLLAELLPAVLRDATDELLPLRRVLSQYTTTLLRYTLRYYAMFLRFFCLRRGGTSHYERRYVTLICVTQRHTYEQQRAATDDLTDPAAAARGAPPAHTHGVPSRRP